MKGIMSFLEDSATKMSTPTPKTMIRQKPPPKPPRMKATMLDQTSPDDPLPSRETSPGIISLKSSIVDATRSLDSPVLYGEYTLERTSRLSPAKNSHLEYWQNILEQMKPFIMLQVDVEALLQHVCSQQKTHVDPGLKLKDEQTIWNCLVTVILSREDEGYKALCYSLRQIGNHGYLADLLHVLERLLDIGINTDFIKSEEKGSLCSVCKFNRDNSRSDESLHDVSKFDVEIICVDSETGQIKSLKELNLSKKPNRKLALSPQDRMLMKNDVDRYVPAISVSIFNQCMCNDGLAQLSKLMQQYSCIRELYVVKNQLDFESVEKLFQGVHRNHALQKLDVRLNPLDDMCAAKLFQCLSGNAFLRVMNVASTGLTANGVAHLLQAFTASKALTELDIGFNNIHNTGAKTISQVLGNNCPLKKLRMRSNYLTEDGARYIFQALKKNSRLTFLDISVNHLKDEGCNYISQALLCNRTIRELNLEDCSIGKGGCQMLARALKTNTNLKCLDLSRNPLRDDGVEALSEGVKYNQVLDVLSLNMCEIANRGFSKLMDALQYNTTMTTLKLCYNLIGYPMVRSPASPSSPPTPLSPSSVTSSSSIESADVPSVQDIYERVCQILQTNKDLKVLLWGNRLDYDEDEDFPLDSNGIPCPATPVMNNSNSFSNGNGNTPDQRNRLSVPPKCNGERKSYNDNNNIGEGPFTSTPLTKRVYSEASVPSSVKDKQNWLYQ